MTISQIIEKMIAFSEGNIHDIDHFIRVWTYAKTIGELESLDANTQYILEIAAIIHDIACPLCREKYGNTNGKHQEAEGMPMAKEFLRDTGLTTEQIDRVVFLVESAVPIIKFCWRRTILPMPPKMGTARRMLKISSRE